MKTLHYAKKKKLISNPANGKQVLFLSGHPCLSRRRNKVTTVFMNNEPIVFWNYWVLSRNKPKPLWQLLRQLSIIIGMQIIQIQIKWMTRRRSAHWQCWWYACTVSPHIICQDGLQGRKWQTFWWHSHHLNDSHLKSYHSHSAELLKALDSSFRLFS